MDRIFELRNNQIKKKRLNPKQAGDDCDEFRSEMFKRVVGQAEAVEALVAMYQKNKMRMTPLRQPIGSLLFMGPTGSGKTRTIEAAADTLFGDSYAMIKIDCAEFQHSHEISKLIGSPPGYLGHRETPPILTQDNLDRWHSKNIKLTLVLFDEIEKASDALWQLLLAVLDKAALTLGDNRKVDFSRCIVTMTSNLGAREMENWIGGGIGYRSTKDRDKSHSSLRSIALKAAKRKFSPEFINRLDEIVVFNYLDQNMLRKIVEIELQFVQKRVLWSGGGNFVVKFGDSLVDYLVEVGFDPKYGGRFLKRMIERLVILPITNLMATKQIGIGEVLEVEFDTKLGQVAFFKASLESEVLSKDQKAASKP